MMQTNKVFIDPEKIPPYALIPSYAPIKVFRVLGLMFLTWSKNRAFEFDFQSVRDSKWQYETVHDSTWHYVTVRNSM